MNIKIYVYVCICLLFVTPILSAEDHKTEIPLTDAKKAICGSWEQEVGGDCPKKIWNQNGTYEWYCYGNEKEPYFTGDFKIEKAWKDSEGNIWCVVWRSFQGDSWALIKISNNGNVQERVVRSSRDKLPAKMDPNDHYYYKDIKKKGE